MSSSYSPPPTCEVGWGLQGFFHRAKERSADRTILHCLCQIKSNIDCSPDRDFACSFRLFACLFGAPTGKPVGSNFCNIFGANGFTRWCKNNKRHTTM